MKRALFIGLNLCSLSLCALSQRFNVHEQSLQVGALGRVVGAQDFKDGAEGHLNYSDATGYATYSHHIGPENVLSLQLGYQHLRVHWDENPRFKGSNYNYADIALGFLSDALVDWRWFLNAGVMVDTDHFNFGHTGVWYGLMWEGSTFLRTWDSMWDFGGRWGLKNAYTLPVIGFDYTYKQKWQLNAIFPFDFSLAYLASKTTEVGLRITTYGGFYKMPYRAKGGIGNYEDGIFSIYSKSLNLYYAIKLGEKLYWDIAGGYNFGGWILSKNSENHHGKYYKFKQAPCATMSIIFNF